MEIVQHYLPFPVADLIRKEKDATRNFSKTKREIVEKLLSDYYLMVSNRRNRAGYVMYQGNMNSVKWYSEKQLRFLYLLFKKSKKDIITLNLSKVRQEHGKSIVKQLYKLSKIKNHGFRSNKP